MGYNTKHLYFDKETVYSRFIGPDGTAVERKIEIRTNPLTGRTSRIAYSRINEKEPGNEKFPVLPPDADARSECPFCRPQVMSKTPQLLPGLAPSDASGRLIQGDSILFPNLFPYGSYSAVSLFDDCHFVEIGQASSGSYADSLVNSVRYLWRVLANDPNAVYMAITQNHLPSAGGSLLHPHLQIHADRIPSNHQRFLKRRTSRYFQETGSYLLSDYLRREREEGERYIGNTGAWEWVAAFAPEGFYEIWGILPQATSLLHPAASDWADLARGIINAQKLYRRLRRNGYNMGILSVEDGSSRLELRVVILARSNYAPWVRNDHTGYEVILGDMTTFISPEETAQSARPFWQ